MIVLVRVTGAIKLTKFKVDQDLAPREAYQITEA